MENESIFLIFLSMLPIHLFLLVFNEKGIVFKKICM